MALLTATTKIHWIGNMLVFDWACGMIEECGDTLSEPVFLVYSVPLVFIGSLVVIVGMFPLWTLAKFVKLVTK